MAQKDQTVTTAMKSGNAATVAHQWSQAAGELGGQAGIQRAEV